MGWGIPVANKSGRVKWPAHSQTRIVTGSLRGNIAMDIIFIRDLRIETVIGIYDWERQIKQIVSLDLEMATDIRRAAASDAIEDTLNYKAVAKRLIQFVGDSQFLLVETLAERIADIVRHEFSVPWLRLTLSKPGAVRGSREVGVIIERGQRE
jgi:dihydroneopterin aldolase